LICNQSMPYLWINIVSEINKFMHTFNPDIFPSTVSYLWNDYNNDKLIVIFTSLLVPKINPVIVFAGDSMSLFNIKPDYPQLLTLVDDQTVRITFYNAYGYSL
jgi:hypothetical protein